MKEDFGAELNKALALAQRDLMKFLRDRPRIVASLIFPVIFLGVFGLTLNSGLGKANLGYNYLDYVFSGILLQTVFQSSLQGINSLLLDREKDFAMSIFVAPVSRYSIVFGKTLGESLVSFAQLIGILAFGKIIGITFGVFQLVSALPILLLGCFVGASFGVLISSRIEKAQTAQQLFPFLVFPMIFLSGAFTPVNNLPLVLNFLKIINPIYYGVDLIRNVMYMGNPALSKVTSNSLTFDLVTFIVLGVAFFIIGSYLFTSKEGNR